MKKPNILDRFVSFISPSAGFRRQKARLLTDAIQKRGYEGASTGRRLGGWSAASQNANAEIASAGVLLRDRSRQLVRDNSYATKAIQTLVSNVIGYGIIGEPKKIDGSEPSEELVSAWNRWQDTTQCDFLGRHNLLGLQALAFRTTVESGECLIRRVITKTSDEEPIPLKLMVLEPDLIDSNKQHQRVTQGIELDPQGKRVAYWLFDKHPGDEKAGSQVSKRVPVEDVLHVFRVDRPGQERGVPWLTPCMVILKDLDEVIDATIAKQKVAAAFAAFVHDIEAAADAVDSDQRALSEKLEPGLIEILPPGKTVEFANPPSTSDFEPFVKAVLREVAAGLGITYESLTGDLGNVNFSSGRMGWLEFYRNIDAWRWHMFIPQFCDGTGKWFLEASSVAMGGVEPIDHEFAWTAPRREMIDPSSETNSAINAIRAGIKSLPEVIRELGEDPKKKLQEIADTNAEIDRLGLILDSDARRTMKAGVIQVGMDASKVGETDASSATGQAAPAEEV